MMQEQIIEMAKRAKVSIRGHYDETGSTPAELQAFTQLVRNASLEEAALKCEQEKEHWFSYVAAKDACVDCAKEIRSLKS